MLGILSFAVASATSFVGSLAAVVVWFHFDLEDRWRLWKVRQGKRRELAARKTLEDMREECDRVMRGDL